MESERLAEFLARSGVESLFERMSQRVLEERPENVPAFLVDYLQKTFPDKFRYAQGLSAPETPIPTRSNYLDESFVSDFETSVLDVPSSLPKSASRLRRDLDVSMISEPDIADENMLPQAPIMPSKDQTFQTQRRGSVCAAPVEIDLRSRLDILQKSEETKLQIKSLLPRYWVTANLDQDEVEDVIGAMEPLKVEKGTHIVRYGASADYYYIIHHGTCTVSEDDIVIHELGDGDGFGELALLYSTPSPVSVVASSESVELFRIDRASFRSIVSSSVIDKRNRHINFLKRVPMFASLEEKKIQALADAMQTRIYKPGEIVVMQGDRGSDFFVIEKGSAEVLHDDECVGLLSFGDYFGEVALLDPSGKRAATVKVLGDQELQVICCRREIFKRHLGSEMIASMKKKIAQYKRTPKRIGGRRLVTIDTDPVQSY